MNAASEAPGAQEAAAPRKASNTGFVWLLLILIGVGGAIFYGSKQANEEEAARNKQTKPPPRMRSVFETKTAIGADGKPKTYKIERKVPVSRPPPADETPEMAGTRSDPPKEAEGEFTEVVLHYGTDRARVDSMWKLVKRDYFLVGIIGLIALFMTFFYKRIVSAPLRKLRWVVYVVCWGAFLYALPSAVQGSWVSYKRYNDLGVWYGKSRNTTSADGFEMGTCTVTIPTKRDVGSVTHPNWWDGEWLPDPVKHFTLAKLEPQDEKTFFDTVKSRVKSADQDSVLLFVHGYNNRFEHAAFRCAQIVHDLQYPGVAMFWSWPSQGEEEGYLVDRTEAERSVSRLAEFLRMIRARSGTKRVQLVAHSMGSWVLTKAVMKLQVDANATEPLFDLIVLGAPDIDADVFKNEIAPELTARGKTVTIYASRNDSALRISEVTNGYPRVGDVNPEPVFVPNIDTIDVSSVCSGHSYIGDNGRVLADLRLLLTLSTPAAQRKAQSSALQAIGDVWKLLTLH